MYPHTFRPMRSPQKLHEAICAAKLAEAEAYSYIWTVPSMFPILRGWMKAGLHPHGGQGLS